VTTLPRPQAQIPEDGAEHAAVGRAVAIVLLAGLVMLVATVIGVIGRGCGEGAQFLGGYIERKL
jgi:acetyl-CoA carboxylase alpha subunit